MQLPLLVDRATLSEWEVGTGLRTCIWLLLGTTPVYTAPHAFFACLYTGGLAFLNKKGWHPGSLRNQEKVWAREQEKDSESRRLDELKEQIEQERAQEEMRGLAKKAGIKQCVDVLLRLICLERLPASVRRSTKGLAAAQVLTCSPLCTGMVTLWTGCIKGACGPVRRQISV